MARKSGKIKQKGGRRDSGEDYSWVGGAAVGLLVFFFFVSGINKIIKSP